MEPASDSTPVRQPSLRTLAISAICMLLTSPASAQIQLRIQNQVTGAIAPELFGQFVELLPSGNREAGADAGFEAGEFRPAVSAALKSLSLPVLRYPGGLIVESPGWSWTKLIDGAEQVTGDANDARKHAFGLHQFLDWSESLGSEPILVVKMADVAREFTPPDAVIEQAAAMLAYVNGRDDESLPPELRRWPQLRAANGRKAPWNVTHWQLGNEFTWVGVTALRKKGLDDAAVARAYIDAVVRTHSRMRAIDPDIRFLVEIDMEQPRVGIRVAEALHQKLGGDIGHMTAHVYHSWGIDKLARDGIDQPIEAMDGVAFWAAAVSSPATNDRGQAVLDIPMLHTANKLGYPLAITEWNWNSWWELPGQDNKSGPNDLHTKGVAAASMLHAMMNAPGRISLATQSMLIGTKWDIRGIDATTGMVHPSAQVTSLYSRFHGRDRLAWETAAPVPCYAQPWRMGSVQPNPKVALIDCVVTRSDSALFLHIINRDRHKAADLIIDTSAVLPSDSITATHHRLLKNTSSNDPIAGLDSIAIDRAAGALWSLAVPAGSVSVLVMHR